MFIAICKVLIVGWRSQPGLQVASSTELPQITIYGCDRTDEQSISPKDTGVKVGVLLSSWAVRAIRLLK
ncbi:MAG: hypothetical protein V7K35_03605 [Nostoc sp.]|uniref:hypothetical protein n=1 Tax=Nostoc sp. TaxID=1180 RepID=UPI002FFC8A09